MQILLTICARGGSKGVPRKNVKLLLGKPLIAYSIETALKWKKADKVIVSTDDEEISSMSQKYGAEVPFIRPAELATDTAAKVPVLQHAVNYCEKKYKKEYDIIVDLQPTSPLRKISDLDEALALFLGKKADLLISVCKARKNPYYDMVELDKEGYAHSSKSTGQGFIRRQDTPPVYEVNGSIYVYNRNFLLTADSIYSGKITVYEMDEISFMDIDSEIDFKFIEFLLEKKIFQFE